MIIKYVIYDFLLINIFFKNIFLIIMLLFEIVVWIWYYYVGYKNIVIFDVSLYLWEVIYMYLEIFRKFIRCEEVEWWCMFVFYIILRLRFEVSINFRIILMFKFISIEFFF